MIVIVVFRLYNIGLRKIKTLNQPVLKFLVKRDGVVDLDLNDPFSLRLI